MGGSGLQRVAAIAAMPGELLHLARGWKHEKRDSGVHLWRTIQGDAEWVAACAGAGQAAATRAFAEVEKDGPVTAAISTGWVGALTAQYLPGRVYAVAGVIDAGTGERFEAAEAVLANGGLPQAPSSWRSPRSKAESVSSQITLQAVPIQPKPWVVTSAKVSGVEEKARLAEAYPAGLVDMEAAAVARLAAMRGIPFYCIKGVSDGHAARLPDFNLFLTPQGQFQLARFIFFAILRPWYWPELMRMSENSNKASQALRDSLLENLRRTGAN
jgi:adenosylhomocysteine nucleosidase